MTAGGAGARGLPRGLLLPAAALATLVVHGVAVVRGFGEPDAARLAVQAAVWHATGSAPSFYTLHTSPLYIRAIAWLLGAGLPMPLVPAVMNWTNVVTSALLVALSFRAYRLLAPAAAAAAATALFWFTPAFWQASVYGMPHLPSIAMFLGALVCYARALPDAAAGRNDGGTPLRRRWAAAAVVLAVLSLQLKADTVLSFGAFPAVAFARRRFDRRAVGLAALVAAVALAAVLVHTRTVLPRVDAPPAFAASWSKRFPFTWRAVTDPTNRAVLVRTTGPVLLAAFVAGIVACTVRRLHPRALAAVSAWGTPALLFWGLKMGNSTRHMMPVALAFALPLGVAVDAAARRRPTAWAAVPLLLVANYFSTPAGRISRSVESRIFESRPFLQGYVSYCHVRGEKFAELPEPRKIYVGTFTVPYVQWEVLARAERYSVESYVPFRVRVTREDGRTQVVRTAYARAGKPFVRPEGFRVIRQNPLVRPPRPPRPGTPRRRPPDAPGRRDLRPDAPSPTP